MPSSSNSSSSNSNSSNNNSNSNNNRSNHNNDNHDNHIRNSIHNNSSSSSIMTKTSITVTLTIVTKINDAPGTDVLHGMFLCCDTARTGGNILLGRLLYKLCFYFEKCMHFQNRKSAKLLLSRSPGPDF